MAGSQQKTNAAVELDEASMHGEVAKVRELLDAGADVNALAKSTRWSPLMNACFMGYWQLAEVLLEAGADVNLANRWGQVPLTIAVHGATMAPDVKPGQRKVRDYAKVVRLLLARGADANVDTWHSTPLMMAQQGNLDAIATALRDAGGKAGYEGDGIGKPPPDLTAGEDRAVFQRVAKEIGQRLGARGQRHEGEAQSGLFFRTTHGPARALVLKEQRRWLKAGVFVFETGDGLSPQDRGRAWVGLMATSDVYDVLRVMETAGGAEGTGAAIEGLKEIEKRNPFRLWFVSEDTLEGEFLADVKNPKLVAEIMEAICSDVRDADALAKQLKGSRRLFLWWD